MRTFAKKPKTTQQAAPAKLSEHIRGCSRQNGEVTSFLHFQRTIGNQAIQCLFKENPAIDTSSRLTCNFSRIPVHNRLIQPKLTISNPGDSHEHETDHIAAQVLRQETAKKDNTLKGEIPSRRLPQALKGYGEPLTSDVLAIFEPRFRTNFSNVRVHTDEPAGDMAHSISARAFTHGRDIYFASGEYDPHTDTGRHLLAHELAHVMQQNGDSMLIHRAALYTGRIYNHGSCYHLACQSRWAIEDDTHGYLCQEGTRNAGRRMRPLFTCDRTEEGAHAAPCRNNQIAIPHSRWRGHSGGQCGQDLVICANNRFVHGIIRDRSHREFWEIGTGLLSRLGGTGGDIQNGAIYPDENDSQFRRDSRCR